MPAYHILGSSPGSLILGGYDRSRSDSGTALQVPFSDDLQVPLTVKVNQVSSPNAQLPPVNFKASIQPDFAYMWLPQEVCDAFSSGFGLLWNSTIELYTISDEAHKKNSASHVSVTFHLCNPDDEKSCAEIALSYGDLALSATFPIVPGNESQRYFPIKPANDSTGYILGRAFLQEAHIFVDWDNRWFNISQTRFDAQTSQIVTVSHPLNSSTIQRPESPTNGLNGGSIAGIVVGSIAALLLVFGAWMLVSWRKKRWPFKPAAVNPPPEQFAKAELDGSGRPWVELSEVERLEMHAHEPPKELPNGSQTAELPGITPIYELPTSNSEPR